MAIEQGGQTLPAAEGGFAADAGVGNGCLRETRPYIVAEQAHPALFHGHVVGGAQAISQDQDVHRFMIGAGTSGIPDEQEQADERQ